MLITGLALLRRSTKQNADHHHPKSLASRDGWRNHPSRSAATLAFCVFSLNLFLHDIIREALRYSDVNEPNGGCSFFVGSLPVSHC